MISFVVIGKNEDWRLEKCLSAISRNAVKELTQPYELIYVDSQSTDKSVEIAKEYVDKVFLITGECNAAIGRNIGAKEATGDILFFLDGDMELREGVLTSIMTGDDQLKHPFMAGVEYDILFDNNWNKKEERLRHPFKEDTEWYESRPSTGMFVIEKSVWDNVGGMDNRFTKSQDYEFGFRAYGKGYPVLRVGKLWVNHYTRYYDVRPDSLSRYKYPAMLTRKYCLKPYAFKTLFMWNYSGYLLFLLLLLLGVTGNVWLLISYLFILVYRTIRVLQKTKVRLNWLTIMYRRFAKDLLLIYYVFTYFPRQPQVLYERIK